MLIELLAYALCISTMVLAILNMLYGLFFDKGDK